MSFVDPVVSDDVLQILEGEIEGKMKCTEEDTDERG